MIITSPTLAQLEEWKQLWLVQKDNIPPQRKTGAQLIDYLHAMFQLEEVTDREWQNTVSFNIIHNAHSAAKLPGGSLPEPNVYRVINIGNGSLLYKQRSEWEREAEHIVVGIDTVSGCYHVEGSTQLWDELCAYQGVDSADLENYVVTAQYVLCCRQRQRYIGRTVSVSIDRALGTSHPKHPDMIYPVNYGFVPGIIAPDNDEQDVYVLGVDRPLSEFRGRIIAVVERMDDVEDKWVAAPDGAVFTKAQIKAQLHFQEQYFDSIIHM